MAAPNFQVLGSLDSMFHYNNIANLAHGSIIYGDNMSSKRRHAGLDSPPAPVQAPRYMIYKDPFGFPDRVIQLDSFGEILSPQDIYRRGLTQTILPRPQPAKTIRSPAPTRQASSRSYMAWLCSSASRASSDETIIPTPEQRQFMAAEQPRAFEPVARQNFRTGSPAITSFQSHGTVQVGSLIPSNCIGLDSGNRLDAYGELEPSDSVSHQGEASFEPGNENDVYTKPNTTPSEGATLYVSNLPPCCDVQQLLETIYAKEKVTSCTVRPPHGRDLAASATLTFCETSAAEGLLLRRNRGEWNVGCYIPSIRKVGAWGEQARSGRGRERGRRQLQLQ